MSIVKNYLFVLICLISMANAMGQGSRSPFSKDGMGDAYGNALVNTQGMAGVGVSQPQVWYLNNQNPALLVYNTLTVFQAGVVAESKTIRKDTASEKSSGGNMNYLATAFPIKPGRWTTSLGLMPYTLVKYKVAYIDFVENRPTDSLGVVAEGTGGLTQLYWSNGIRINREWAVGLKAAYIFSSIKNTYSNQLLRSGQALNFPITVEKKIYVQDLDLTAGVSYSKDSLFTNKRYRLSFGSTVGLPSSLNTRVRYEFYRNSPIAGPIDSDTLTNVKGSTRIPLAVTVGASLGYGTRWHIGTEFSYQDWSEFKSVDQSEGVLGTSWRAALGGEITPDLLSTSYLKRVTYRVGLSYEQTPYRVDRNEGMDTPDLQAVKDLGINFGISLPAGQSSLDLAFRYGKRGNKTDTIIAEDYFRIYFGITFNDRWFIKRKFD